MKVDELMSEATCCSERTTARECAQLMKEANIGFVPICSEQGEPVGAVTDRDLAIRLVAEGRSCDDRIEQFMSRDVVACRLGDEVQEAERLMQERRKSRIMVCDAQGQLKGVISLADIADAEPETSPGETLAAVKSDAEQPSAH